jgi:hypothetical protein
MGWFAKFYFRADKHLAVFNHICCLDLVVCQTQKEQSREEPSKKHKGCLEQ